MRYAIFFLLLICSCGRNEYLASHNEFCGPYLVLMHNKQRCLKGEDQFEIDESLMRQAQKHAEWMAAHSSLTHSKLAPVEFRTMGENIAQGQPTEDVVIIDWMK